MPTKVTARDWLDYYLWQLGEAMRERAVPAVLIFWARRARCAQVAVRAEREAVK